MVDGRGDKFRFECDFQFANGLVGVLDSHPAVVHLQGLAGTVCPNLENSDEDDDPDKISVPKPAPLKTNLNTFLK